MLCECGYTRAELRCKKCGAYWKRPTPPHVEVEDTISKLKSSLGTNKLVPAGTEAKTISWRRPTKISLLERPSDRADKQTCLTTQSEWWDSKYDNVSRGVRNQEWLCWRSQQKLTRNQGYKPAMASKTIRVPEKANKNGLTDCEPLRSFENNCRWENSASNGNHFQPKSVVYSLSLNSIYVKD
jgi:hypothetical protein